MPAGRGGGAGVGVGGHAELADLCKFVVYKQNQHGGRA